MTIEDYAMNHVGLAPLQVRLALTWQTYPQQ